MATEYETVREVCAEMRDCANNETLGVESEREKSLSKFMRDIIREYAERAEEAHELEMAAKDAEIARLTEERNKLAINTFIKNCMAHNCSAWERISLLERALEPVLECNTMDAAFGLDNALFAVRKAQRIYREGGAK